MTRVADMVPEVRRRGARPADVRQKISETLKGRKHTPEHVAKIIAARGEFYRARRLATKKV